MITVLIYCMWHYLSFQNLCLHTLEAPQMQIVVLFCNIIFQESSHSEPRSQAEVEADLYGKLEAKSWLCLGLGIHIEVHRGHNSEVTDWSMMEFPWAVNNNLNIIANIAMWPRKALPVWVVCMWPFIRRGDVLRKGEAEWKLVAANLKLSWVSSVTVKVLLNIQVTLLFQIEGI